MKDSSCLYMDYISSIFLIRDSNLTVYIDKVIR